MGVGSISNNSHPDDPKPKPSVVPEGPIDENGADHRPVIIGTFRLSALRHIFPKGTPFKYLMKFFGSDSSLPSPTEHWAIVVGGYYHELVILPNRNVAYENGPVTDLEALKKQNWNFFEIDGITAFNDAAIVKAAIESINMMEPAYHLRKNNCQTFVVNLLNKICLPGRKLVLTAVSNREEASDAEFSAPVEAEKVMENKTQHVRTAKDLAELLNYYEPGTIVDLDEEE